MKKLNLLLNTLCLSLLSLSLFAGPTSFTGKAVDNKTGKVIYLEKHKVEYRDELVQKVTTVYTDPNGKEFARLNSEFKANFHLPNSEFIDKRNGYKEVTELETIGKEVRFQVKTISKTGKEKKRNLEIDDNLVCGQGYHNYIIKNLQNFKVGETRELKFIIPSMRDYFTFDLTYLGPLDSSKPDEVSLRLDITNFILRMFADKILVTYSLKDKKLLKYVGLTNITNEEDEQYDATITYTFE